MKINIPNAVWLNSIDPFLEKFDSRFPDRLEISFHKKWMSIHPFIQFSKN